MERKMMARRTQAAAWWAAVAVFAGMHPAVAEEVTLTTYYPSPRGMYEELRTTDNAFLATLGGDVGIGTTDPASKLAVSGGASIGAGFTSTAAPSNGLLVQGNVGIANSAPSVALDVTGDTEVTHQVRTMGVGSLPGFYALTASGVQRATLRYDGGSDVGGFGAFYTDGDAGIVGVAGTPGSAALSVCPSASGPFGCPGTAVIHMTSLGNLYAMASIAIGKRTASSPLDVVGNVAWTGDLSDGNVPWARLSTYPAACTSNKALTAVDDTPTCNYPEAVYAP